MATYTVGIPRGKRIYAPAILPWTGKYPVRGWKQFRPLSAQVYQQFRPLSVRVYPHIKTLKTACTPHPDPRYRDMEHFLGTMYVRHRSHSRGLYDIMLLWKRRGHSISPARLRLLDVNIPTGKNSENCCFEVDKWLNFVRYQEALSDIPLGDRTTVNQIDKEIKRLRKSLDDLSTLSGDPFCTGNSSQCQQNIQSIRQDIRCLQHHRKQYIGVKGGLRTPVNNWHDDYSVLWKRICRAYKILLNESEYYGKQVVDSIHMGQVFVWRMPEYGR